MALLSRLSGLGISNPSKNSDDNFDASMQVTAPLRQLESNETTYSYQALTNQMIAKTEVQRKRKEQALEEANSLKKDLAPSLLRAMELASERGSSSWLITRRIWVYSAQESLCQCFGTEIWLDPIKHSKQLCLWI